MAQEDRVQELADALDGKDEPSELESTDQPEATPDEDAGTEAQDTQTKEDAFFDLDLSSVPENADREWLAKRHGDMQKAFTQKTQSLAELRREAEKITQAFNDPDALAHLLRERGYDLEDDDEPELDDEFGDFRQTPEWQQFQQFQNQLAQAGQQEAEEQQFRSSVKELETREGREVDDTEWELLWSLAQAGVPPDDGWERISQLRKQERKAHVKSKQAPQVAKVGKSATQVPDLSDERTRVDFLAEAIEANRQG